MTGPLDPELLERFNTELRQLKSLPPASIELSAEQAMAIIIHIQICASNPAVRYSRSLPSAIAAAKQIQSSFNPDSAIHEWLELGWYEPEISSGNAHQIVTSVLRRLKKLR